LNPLGIGHRELSSGFAAINQWLSKTFERVGKVDVVGHSLGGALAQLTAANFSQFIQTVVTFNSPGIDNASVQKLRDTGNYLNVHHYIVAGDLVSYGGEQFLPGNVVEISGSPLINDAASKLLSPLNAVPIIGMHGQYDSAKTYLKGLYENHVELGLLNNTSRSKSLFSSEELNARLQQYGYIETIRHNAIEWLTNASKFGLFIGENLLRLVAFPFIL
jgi:pimeloyl-ACP methyl ester carboxylesterase